MIKIISTKEEKFIDSPLPVLFKSSTARSYYFLLFNNKKLFTFSSQSEITPQFIKVGSVIAVGIDQNIGFYDITKNEIVKRVELISFFYNFYLSERYILIICELEIIVLDSNTLIEQKDISFSEYIDHVSLNNNILNIRFINGVVETVLL